MDSRDIISRAVTRPQCVTVRYFVVENVEAVAKTCYTTTLCLRIAPMVVVVHECIASWTGIANLGALLTSYVIAVETPDVIPSTVSCSHGVARGNLVVKHIARFALAGYTTGISIRVTTAIVVEHEGLANWRRGTQPCTLCQISTMSCKGQIVVSRWAFPATDMVATWHSTAKLSSY